MLNNFYQCLTYVIQYYFDKTKIWLKIASKGPLTPRFLHTVNASNQPLAPDYYFCFFQVGTSVYIMLKELLAKEIYYRS